MLKCYRYYGPLQIDGVTTDYHYEALALANTRKEAISHIKHYILESPSVPSDADVNISEKYLSVDHRKEES